MPTFHQDMLPVVNRLSDRIPKKTEPAPFAEPPRSLWSGATPGQHVMGVHDLGGDGPQKKTYVVDPTGMVNDYEKPRLATGGSVSLSRLAPTPEAPEQHLNDSRAAHRLYPTHGGMHADGLLNESRSAALAAGYNDVRHYLKKEEHYTDRVIDANEADSARVNAHWAKQPVHQISASAPIHTAQHEDETYDEKDSSKGLRQSLQNGAEVQKPAWLVKKAGRLYALDGHHRMNAAREEGKSHFPAHVWDMDAEDKGKPKAAAKAMAKMPKPKGLTGRKS